MIRVLNLAHMTTLYFSAMGVLLASPLVILYYRRKIRPIPEGSIEKGNTPSNDNNVCNTILFDSGKIKPKRDWKSIPPNKLVQDVLFWAQFNIPFGKNRKVRPKIKVNFSREEEAYGRYHFTTRTIEIFYKRHELIEELVDTILHEYVHHLQLMYVKTEMEVNLLIGKISDQPFEDEARLIAKKYRRMCVRDLGLR